MGQTVSKSSKSTTKDSQCLINPAKPTTDCLALPGYDAASCTNYSMHCYPNAPAAQCTTNSQCKLSYTGECVNSSGGSSLYCRHTGPYGECECYVPSLNAKVWPSQTSTGGFYFPEDAYLPVETKNSMSLALSGGGLRAVNATAGVLKFLQRNGALSMFRYASTVSGGGLAYGMINFGQSSGYTMTEMFGSPGRMPHLLTLANLDSDNMSSVILSAVTRINTLKTTTKLLAPGSNTPLDQFYETLQYEISVKPSLKNYSLNVPMAMNAAHAADIETRNPQLSPAITPLPSFPFWLSNASLLYQPLLDQGIVLPVVMTPLYSGIPAAVTAPDGSVVGGVWVETIALGTSAPTTPVPIFNDNNAETLVNVKTTRDTAISLQTLAGATSAAFAEYLFSNTPSAMPNINAKFNFWSPQAPGVTQKKLTVGDGCLFDNTGIIALLARKVPRIFSFLSSGFPVYTGATVNIACYIEDLQPLFGVQNNICATPLINNQQVFPQSEYAAFAKQIENNYAAGGPSFAIATLPVISNTKYGVKATAGYSVRLMVLVLAPSSQFNDLLAPEITAEFKIGGSLAGFPNYGAFFNLPPDPIQMSSRQWNLLSTYTEWCMEHPSVQAALTQLDGGSTVTRYSCNSSFQCVAAGTGGAYGSLKSCTDNCVPGYYCDKYPGPPRCIPLRAGPNKTQAECEASCT